VSVLDDKYAFISVCENCQQRFKVNSEIRRKKKKYCSPSCSQKARRERGKRARTECK
jgi:hypothetical protein